MLAFLSALFFSYSSSTTNPVVEHAWQVQFSDTARQDSLKQSAKSYQKSDPLSRKKLYDSLHFVRDNFGILRDSAGFPVDTLRLFADSTAERVDSTWVVYLDSTARMEQLAYRRSDAPAVEMFPRQRSSLFVQTRSSGYQREIHLDSTGSYVTVREMVNGVDVKVPTTLTLDEYIHMRYEEEKLNNWRTFTREYTVKKDQDELGGLLSNFTNIDIPVPSNPILNIFGKPNINLHTSGQIDIRAAFRSVKSDQASLNTVDVSRSEPDFNQQVQINVSGTVGDKLNILADWNTQRTFEYENSLKIKYTGYEDEIVQSVEAGNVSLQTPGLIGGGQALFGIKARFQLGPLSLMGIISQKKGQTKELTATGGQQSATQDIQPQSFSQAYYFVDTLYRKFWAPLHQSASYQLTQEMQENQIIQIDLWQSVPQSTSNTGKIFKGKAYVDLPGRPVNQKYPDTVEDTLGKKPGGKYFGNFIQLEAGKDYRFRFDGGRQVYGGYVILNSSVPDDQALAVTYTILGAGQSTSFGTKNGTYNDTTADGSYLLKLIKPTNLSNNPGYLPAWKLQLRNIYPLGGRDLKPEGFKLQVFRRTESSDVDQINGVNLLKVLGLDRFDANNSPKPDDFFDFIPGMTVDIERAELVFPSLNPFDSAIVDYFSSINKPLTSDSLLFSDIYDTTQLASQNNIAKNRYIMRVQASTAISSRYSLGFNVVEGSVHVLLDGQELQPNTDYTVDYIVGEVNIKRQEAALPGHNVQVKFEQNDLFQLASKTLMGARGELALFPNTNIGFTAMNLNQATLSDKVRLGEEPTNNLMLGVDGGTTQNLPFLTNLIDALPFIRTREMSSIRLTGEGAYSLPDPNTMKSTLTGDNGASVAFIDDFEGARQTISIDISFANWRMGSPPVYTLLGASINDTSKSFHRARLWWYNNPQGYETVPTTDIWPYRSVQRGQEAVYPLYLEFDPLHRGTYNFSPKLDSTLARNDPAERAKNWNGVMRYIGSYAGSLLEKNISYLEVWAQVYDRTTLDNRPADMDNVRGGRLYIDLGRVKEDVLQGRLNSEDIIVTDNNPQGIPRGVSDDQNDRGLDLIFNADEQATFQGFLQSNTDALGVLDPDINPNDPSGDDYDYVNNIPNFSRINGLEGNIKIRRDPDTEDLNRNGNVDFDDEYVEYEIPLDTLYKDSNQVLQNNPLIVGGNKAKGWYQFRIPLVEPNRVVGGLTAEATLANVKYIRMWVSGFRDPVIIRVAEINLVGNQWIPTVTRDSLLSLSVVNLEDNPEYNTPDYQNLGIVRQRDKTQPDQVILANEQSLSLVINGLPVDSSRDVYKTYPVRPLDIFNYKTMKMFVHGDPTFNAYGDSSYAAQIYVRFGADTLNYYEYTQPVWRGWDPQNEISIPFAELTAIKASRDSVKYLYIVPANNGKQGAKYGVKGSPSLRSIRYVGIGIRNPRSPGKGPLYGEVWVNELRLVDVNNDPGYAYHFETQIKLADLGNVAFNFSRTDPNFHGLDQRFGNQNDTRNWAINANMELARFLPESWQGTQMSASYSHGENLIKPKYLPNTDVVVASAATRADERNAADPSTTVTGAGITTASQTLHVQNSYALTNFRIVPPSQFFILRDILSKITLGFNYNTAKDRDPVTELRSIWNWNGTAGYGVNFAGDYYFQPFKSLFSWFPLFKEYKDWKLFYMPFTSFQARIGAQRSRTYDQSRIANSPVRDTRGFGVSKSLGFGWKLTEGGLTGLSGDYGLTMDRNLIDLDNDSVGRDFSSILHSIFFGGQDNRYGQRMTFNLKPNLPNILNMKQYFDLTAGYAVNYGWQNTFQLGDIGKGAGFDNNITLGSNIKLKAIFDPLFQPSPDEPMPQIEPEKPKTLSKPGDSTSSGSPNKPTSGKSKSLLSNLKSALNILIKIPFLDFENIGVQFSEQNRSGNSGVVGSTGFLNFWGRLPFQDPLLQNGPSRLYQLGLIADPSGTLQYSPKSSFPFVGWQTNPGIRAASAQLQDQYSQSNNLTMRTNRALWDGASLEVNWKVGWQYSKTVTFQTDANGERIPTTYNTTTTGSVERSYLSFPPVFIFKVFNSSLENVGKKYDQLIAQGAQPAAAATESFEKGLEALPFMSKIFGQFWPRANWTLRWDGIERIGGLNSVLERLSLEHVYASTFRKDYRGAIDGSEQTDNERTTYGFTPLIGLNATFKEFLKGSLAGTVRLNTTTSYDLSVSTQQISESYTREISMSFSYQRRGFKLPLFGLSLNNDVDFSVTFSQAKNSRRNYDPKYLSQNQDGSPLDGNTRTTLEPRMRYTLSAQVSASLFYRYSRVAPDEGGSTSFGTTTNEAGVDVHISIR